MASLTFTSVFKRYSGGTAAVRDLNLDIADGEFVVLVGPSGCGKTTSLRMVAGLEDITSGEIAIGGRRINELEPHKRDVAMVFQNYALYPHMTVFENMSFPLQCQRVSRQEIRVRVEETAALLGLTELLRRRPRTLSGGQRQRVAMGRAIVRQPELLLLDEPLSNLDAKLRSQMRAEISQRQKRIGTTTVYVTHDQIEAMTMGTHIAVMRAGVLQQYGDPSSLFESPANLFVASFIGSPGMNLFRALVIKERDGLALRVGDQKIALDGERVAADLLRYVDREVAVGIRPQYIEEPYAGRGEDALKGEVVLVENVGTERLVHIEVAAEAVLTSEILEIAGDMDTALRESMEREGATHRVAMIARFREGAPAERGEIRVRLPSERLHFFDLDTGMRV